jgi:hypothetical protein
MPEWVLIPFVYVYKTSGLVLHPSVLVLHTRAVTEVRIPLVTFPVYTCADLE